MSQIVTGNMVSLARLDLLKSKAYTAEDGGTGLDNELKSCLIAATQIANDISGRRVGDESAGLVMATYHDELYTGNDTSRLWINHWPIRSVEYVKLWDGSDSYDTEDATYYTIVQKKYLKYPALGKETSATWSDWKSDYEDGIMVSYTAGYDCTGWESVADHDTWTVPHDLEDAVCMIAMKKWYDAKGGGGRFGMVSIAKEGGSISIDKFTKGIPDEAYKILTATYGNVRI